jgi:hypothetical protein
VFKNIALKLALIGLVLMFARVAGGPIAGRFSPVATDFEILRIEPAPNGSSRIWGQFNLVRPDCDFIGIDWVLSGNRRAVSVTVVFEEGAKERGEGIQPFGPWLVQLTPVQLQHGSRAVVYHSCPYRPWITETHLFP